MMPRIIQRNDSAIIVLHEIYGVNAHVKWVCEHYLTAGYDVFCPNFMNNENYFDYCAEEKAYRYFVEHIGIFSMADAVKRIIIKIRKDYKSVFLLGFSVGATAAWLCSESEDVVDGVICYYGSRIRDYQSITPKCPVLLLFAEEEESLNVLELKSALEQKQFVNIHVLNGQHGFSDPFSLKYNLQSQSEAQGLVDRFLISLK